MNQQYVHNLRDKVSNPDQALELLKQGNKRFVESKQIVKKQAQEDIAFLTAEQHPFAAILCCSDSRVAAELIFDQKDGDIFTVRNAGNMADSTALGSIEYAVEHLHVPLIVICGHQNCGAVGAAYSGASASSNLQPTLDAIGSVKKEGDSVEEVNHKHVINMAEVVRNNAAVKENGTRVVEAHYAIETGLVTWN